MAKYTIELGRIEESKSTCVFDFDYYFYEPNLKGQFEKKFIDYYYFDEIGFETVARFKQRLRARLNLIAPKYRQLYETELKAKDINFLLNKDLTEKTIREITRNDNSTLDSNTNDTSNVNIKTNDTTDYKESNLNNGNATLSKEDLTTINENINNSNQSSDTTNSGNAKSIGSSNSVEKDEFTLISQGNIGITSSAELLQKWREVIINIDQMIIEECRGLFMEVL